MVNIRAEQAERKRASRVDHMSGAASSCRRSPSRRAIEIWQSTGCLACLAMGPGRVVVPSPTLAFRDRVLEVERAQPCPGQGNNPAGHGQMRVPEHADHGSGVIDQTGTVL